MKGLEKLIIDLAKVTCPSENDLFQEEVPCSKFYESGENQEMCIACWRRALEEDAPTILSSNKL